MLHKVVYVIDCITDGKLPEFFLYELKILNLFQLNYILEHYEIKIAFLALSNPFHFSSTWTKSYGILRHHDQSNLLLVDPSNVLVSQDSAG